MDFVTIFFIALGLSFDSFAVSLTNGLYIKRISAWQIFQSSMNLALFQGIMPLIGYYLAIGFLQFIQNYDHWVAFALLLFIGLKMIYESFHKKEEKKGVYLSRIKLVAQGIGTSIDALAIGVSFAILDIEIFKPVIIIFIVTFIASFIGIKIGKYYGKILGSKMEILGGIILIAIGFKILFEHLFFQ